MNKALAILGVGCARPENLITNDLLVELGLAPSASSILESTGLSLRHTTLPLSYIRETGNADILQASRCATESPTDLALRAAEMAVASAGIEKSAIGLIIGDSATPWQTTPSEAQRLGPRFGIKVPAYDVCAASGAFALSLDILTSWSEEKIPDYVLLLSTNTPTQSIDYRHGRLPFYFGDCATALVVSTRHNGRLNVTSASAMITPSECADYYIDTYGYLSIQEEVVFPELLRHTKEVMASAPLASFNPTHAVLPHLPFNAVRQVWKEQGFAASVLGADGIQAESFGSTAAAVIADNWRSFTSGDRIAVVQSGLGISCGLVLLEGV